MGLLLVGIAGLIVFFLCLITSFVYPHPAKINFDHLNLGNWNNNSHLEDKRNVFINKQHLPQTSSPVEDEHDSISKSIDRKKLFLQRDKIIINYENKKAEREVVIVFVCMTLMWCYMTWTITYLAQLNPLISPELPKTGIRK